MTIKLLAVDDSKTMRRVLQITFSGEEFETAVAGSPDEALSALGANKPQVAVVDGYLGGPSGYDLCREIKARAPDIRILLLSSKQRPYDAAQGSAAGVDDSFDKPFDSTKFIDKVKQVVGVEAGTPAPGQAARPPAPQHEAPAARPRAAAPSAGPAPQPTAGPRPSLSQPRPSVGARPAAPVASRPAQQAQAAAPRPTPAQEPAERAPQAAAIAAASTDLEGKLKDLGLTAAQMEGVLSLSREVVEQVVWEVVPALAETMIKEEIARLTAD